LKGTAWRLRGKLLLDTGPLWLLIARRLAEDAGLEPRRVPGGCNLVDKAALWGTIERLHVGLATTWPVVTEALYYIASEAKSMHKAETKEKIYASTKQALARLVAGTLCGPSLDKVLEHWSPRVGDIADASLLAAAQADTLAHILTCDERLANYARKLGLRVVTVYELLSLL